jgi:hypothetical protein
VEAGPSAIEEGATSGSAPRSSREQCSTTWSVSSFQKSWDTLRYEEDPSGEATTTARRGYRVGTLELTLPPGEPTTQLFRDLAILKSRRQAPKRERDSSRWNRAIAVGGILQGLLDFQRIEDYELADVFAEVDIDAEDQTMLAFHKGTLLSLAAAEPEEDEPTDQPGDDDAGAQDEPERVPRGHPERPR